MRNIVLSGLALFSIFSLLEVNPAFARGSRPTVLQPAVVETGLRPVTLTKDWTLLVFLNGKNNLDTDGFMNLEEMEKVGSNDHVNVVVEWGSSQNGEVRRLLVQKSSDPSQVTSPVLQHMGKVDMGDYHSLVDFVRWGVQNYPAEHYMIDVWDHGSGWHNVVDDLSVTGAPKGHIGMFDISFDEESGHAITTADLGTAMQQSAAIIGHKVDIYGSDACLMAMAEIADEMADSVSVSVGSEETEPEQGWPYADFLSYLSLNPSASPLEAGRQLAQYYLQAYSGGVYGQNSVTFSAYDLGQMPVLRDAVAGLGKKLLSANQSAQIVTTIGNSQSFKFSPDYVDLGDFLTQLGQTKVSGIADEDISPVRLAIAQFVAANQVSSDYQRATGVSIWLPSDQATFSKYSTIYQGLKFADTGWGTFLSGLLGPAGN